MKRKSIYAAVAGVLMTASAGWACDCGGGGSCSCSGGCGCGGESSAKSGSGTNLAAQVLAETSSAPVVVDVSNFSFSANPTIALGQTVEWDWTSGFHSVTSVVGSAEAFDSGDLSAGTPTPTFTHTFTHAGKFWYYCDIHGFDNGNGTAGGMAAFVTVLLPGDANENGVIDPDDFALTDRGFLKGLSGWQNGDFNGDGVVNAADYQLLEASFASTHGGAFAADAIAASLGVTLPEPGVVVGLGGLGLMVLRRQRRGGR